MNAHVPYTRQVDPSDHDKRLLCWLVENAGSPVRVRDVAARLGCSEANASLRVQRLRALGLVERGRGCCEPTGRGVALGRSLLFPSGESAATGRPGASTHAPRETVPSPAMESRDSTAPPLGLPMDELVAALAAHQDPLLQAANAQLRLRVAELEDEVAQLRARLVRGAELLAACADALA